MIFYFDFFLFLPLYKMMLFRDVGADADADTDADAVFNVLSCELCNLQN